MRPPIRPRRTGSFSAQGRGSRRETATALFRAYFADGPNVSAPEGLVGCAAAAMPGASVMK